MNFTTASHCCVYAMCKNTRKTSPNLRFYTFPVKDQNRRKTWILNSGNLELFDLSDNVLKTKTICELHFSKSSFRDFSAPKKFLNKSAVPINHVTRRFSNDSSPENSEDSAPSLAIQKTRDEPAVDASKKIKIEHFNYESSGSSSGEAARDLNSPKQDDNIQNIIREAIEVREHAYCPYSNFKVGAAVLCTDGKIFTGCNIENSSFTVGVCAERVAYSKAISEGKLNFQAVAVVADQEKSFTTPCGACRQFMSEFGNIDIYIAKPGKDEVLVSSLDVMLPYQFQTTNKTFL